MASIESDVLASGALLTLVLFHKQLDLDAFVGILLLFGVVKKNAIMMVDFAIDQRTRPPTISSSASQPGVPSSREYARCSPSTKFDAGHGGTFSGEPGRRSRPAEISHDSIEPGSPASCSVQSLDVIARF